MFQPDKTLDFRTIRTYSSYCL